MANKDDGPDQLDTTVDIWTENDSSSGGWEYNDNDAVDCGVEEAPPRSPPPPPPPPFSKGGSKGKSREAAKKNDGKTYGTHGKTYGSTVSICGSTFQRRHVIAAIVLAILIAGGTIAALFATGAIGGGDGTSKSDLPVEGDEDEESAGTSCVDSIVPFQNIGNDGEFVTTTCLDLTTTAAEEVEVQEVCGRAVPSMVAGERETVQTRCPELCGGCRVGGGVTDTALPTLLRPTLNPTGAPFDATDDDAVIDPPASFGTHDTFTFYVMGDIPYRYKEELTLVEQLQNQTRDIVMGVDDDAVFQVHVGDIQNPQRSQCVESRYSLIAGYFTSHAILPTLVLPGDNDWNDCPDPDLAWEYWTEHFGDFEQNWASGSDGGGDFVSTVQRQDGQPENFAFDRGGVLFMGFNLVGGTTNDIVTEEDWDVKIDADILWASQHFAEYSVGESPKNGTDPNYIRAVILFGHSPRARRFNNFFKDRMMGTTDIPFVYIHGNGHDYKVVQPFLESESDDGWENFWQVQVDQGANAPPVKITVRGTTEEALGLWSMEVDGGMVFDDFIKLDRRGGLYPGVEPNQPAE